MATEKLKFTGSGGDELSARLDTPDDREPRTYILFAHFFTGSKDALAASRIAKSLVGRGFGVFRFDFTGLGESQGDFANTTFSSNVGDLVAAADYLRNHRRAPTVLIGHSLGGAAVISAAQRIEEVEAVSTIGAPAEPQHVAKLFESHLNEIEEKGEADVEIAGRSFHIKKSFLDDLKWHNQEECIKNLHRGLMIFHSPIDEIVGIENAAKIYQAARHPKSFVALEGADHMLSNRKDSEYVAEVVSSWVHRYGFCHHNE